MDNTPEQTTPIETLKQLFLESGLPVPPIPKGISSQLFRPDNSAYFTTRKDAPGPWSLGWFLEEIEYGNPANYLMTGVDGHGIESAANHYYLVESDIAIFHQSTVVSPENPEPEDSLEDQYQLIAIMTVAIEQAKKKKKLAENSRLVVVRPTYQTPFWGIQPEPGQPVDWHEASDALLSASGWLAELMD